MRNVQQLKTQTLFVTLIGFVYVSTMLLGYPIGDILERIIGIECPSCGFMTAWYWLFKGNLQDALYFHPLFIVPVLGVILYVINNNLLKENSKYIIYTLYFLFAIYILLYVVRIFYDIPGVIELNVNPFN